MTSNPTTASADLTGDFEAVSEAELVQEELEPVRLTPEPALRAVRDDRPSDPESVDARGVNSELRLLPAREASGTRPSPAALMARVEAAVAASARTEAALSDLLRTAKFLSASIAAVRDANAGLVHELEVLCEVVDGDGAQRMVLERRIHRLERILGDTTRDAESERAFLVQEHDSFIAQLVSDHESELASLRKRLAELGIASAEAESSGKTG